MDCFTAFAMTMGSWKAQRGHLARHCERSAAIHGGGTARWIAASLSLLAMTREGSRAALAMTGSAVVHWGGSVNGRSGDAQRVFDGLDQLRVHRLAGGTQVTIRPHDRPGVAEHVAGALQVA